MIASHEESKKTKWNEIEVCVLLDYLLREKSKIGGAGVFPMAVYDAAAVHLNMHFTSCRPKTGRTCKTKWNAVRDDAYLPLYRYSFIASLKVSTMLFGCMEANRVFTGMVKMEQAPMTRQPKRSGGHI